VGLTTGSQKTNADESAQAQRRDYWRRLFAEREWKNRRLAYETKLKTDQVRRDDETPQQYNARVVESVQSALREFDKTFEGAFQAYFGADFCKDERKAWLPTVARKSLLPKAYGALDSERFLCPALVPIKRPSSKTVSSHTRCVTRSRDSRSLPVLQDDTEKGAF
jgi:hypothetical protein